MEKISNILSGIFYFGILSIIYLILLLVPFVIIVFGYSKRNLNNRVSQYILFSLITGLVYAFTLMVYAIIAFPWGATDSSSIDPIQKYFLNPTFAYLFTVITLFNFILCYLGLGVGRLIKK